MALSNRKTSNSGSLHPMEVYLSFMITVVERSQVMRWRGDVLSSNKLVLRKLTPVGGYIPLTGGVTKAKGGSPRGPRWDGRRRRKRWKVKSWGGDRRKQMGVENPERHGGAASEKRVQGKCPWALMGSIHKTSTVIPIWSMAKQTLRRQTTCCRRGL